ncbi:uncharacterized protein [Asterias amurensis]|uniref:uncharacterized protein n=1 Tax=Asterias amurensis TaxID=7602 RepID=UPI003AB86FB8
MAASMSLRSCLLCGTQLITCKHYVSLNCSSTKANPSIMNLADEVSHITKLEIHELKVKYVCSTCQRKVLKVKSSRQASEEIQRKYEATITTPVTSPKKRISQKRTAESSPGTPSVKVRIEPQVKRVLQENKQPEQAPRQARASMKKLVYTSPTTDIEVIFHHGSKVEKKTVAPQWLSVVSAITDNNEEYLIQEVMKLKGAKELVFKGLKEECELICAPATKSCFRNSTLQGLTSFNFNKQLDELKLHAPTFLQVLQISATSKYMQKNKLRTIESLTPNIMTAASIIFNCRSQDMNSHQLVNGFTLLEGGCSKQVFQRLHTRGVSSAYQTVLSKQAIFGNGFDNKVKEWASTAADESAVDTSEVDSPLSSYQIVMDNVDIRVRARHTTKDHHGTDFHMVNTMAVKDRVTSSLTDLKPEVNVDKLNLRMCLPSVSDNQTLKHNWSILIGHIIADHLPAMQWMKRELPQEIHHSHMSEARQKSEVVNLGVIMENENTSEGILKTMQYMHQYVPGHATDKLTRVISAGDLLSCERESSCQEQQQNSDSPSSRFEGLMPVIADFHTYANFLEVIWKHLYDPSSSAEKGTLYNARNFLEARNVTKDPIRDINAASDLIESYTKSLVVTAAMTFFKMQNVTDEPQQNGMDSLVHHNRKEYVMETMSTIVSTYVVPSNDELSTQTPRFQCHHCDKSYKTKKGLQRHIRDKHSTIKSARTTTTSQHSSDDSTVQDHVFNYTRCALSMGLLALDFTDARRLGDGERLMIIYKHLLLHFKAGGKPKYSYHVLRLLAQVNWFLSPRLAHSLTWNQFVNKTGTIRGNIEVDREMEHHNRVFKMHCKALRGKISPKSVERVSHSAQVINNILCDVDKQTSFKKPSGKHGTPDNKKDVSAMAMEMLRGKIFEHEAGRQFSSFPSFRPSLFGSLTVPEMVTWIRSTITTLRQQYILGRSH